MKVASDILSGIMFPFSSENEALTSTTMYTLLATAPLYLFVPFQYILLVAVLYLFAMWTHPYAVFMRCVCKIKHTYFLADTCFICRYLFGAMTALGSYRQQQNIMRELAVKPPAVVKFKQVCSTRLQQTMTQHDVQYRVFGKWRC